MKNTNPYTGSNGSWQPHSVIHLVDADVLEAVELLPHGAEVHRLLDVVQVVRDLADIHRLSKNPMSVDFLQKWAAFPVSETSQHDYHEWEITRDLEQTFAPETLHASLNKYAHWIGF